MKQCSLHRTSVYTGKRCPACAERAKAEAILKRVEKLLKAYVTTPTATAMPKEKKSRKPREKKIEELPDLGSGFSKKSIAVGQVGEEVPA
jgi:hypothetical protein